MSRIGSPWLRLGSNSARMNPTASRNLFKPLPALREPISGPKYRTKNQGSAAWAKPLNNSFLRRLDSSKCSHLKFNAPTLKPNDSNMKFINPTLNPYPFTPYSNLNPWYHGTMAPWHHGTIVPWYHGTMVPWYHGAMVPWCHGNMVPWYHAAMLPWCHSTMVPWLHGTMVTSYHSTTAPWYHGAMVPW